MKPDELDELTKINLTNDLTECETLEEALYLSHLYTEVDKKVIDAMWHEMQEEDEALEAEVIKASKIVREKKEPPKQSESVTKKRTDITPDMEREISRMLDEGYRVSAIASKFGLSHGAVNSRKVKREAKNGVNKNKNKITKTDVVSDEELYFDSLIETIKTLAHKSYEAGYKKALSEVAEEVDKELEDLKEGKE